ncbi:MAG: ABC transporter ATP-binding protein [Alphaproteobacteria bacterium]|nr:ABC transporter ATP-binding protein [Alphaproteobacteria bacterium]MBV8548460.1 ABC transporter ATP-binding protein [Alphaproteobacteria bacterium]
MNAISVLPPLPDYAVEVSGVTKTYRGNKRMPPKEALRGIDLKIPRGCIFGLLGPNGAGKSTLINILAGLVIKSSGEAKVWGYEVDGNSRMAKSAIGVVPQELNLDAFFTPRELLEVQAGLYGVPKKERRTDELLEAVDLTAKAHAYARTLSGGMRRRLMVAKAMVHNPPVLVLDEPTAGVDVELRRALWDYVRKLNAAGTTVLLTTHYLEEAQELCDQIAIINHGELVAHDTTRNLLGRIDSKRVTITVDRDLIEVPANMQPYGWQMETPRTLSLVYMPSKISIGQLLMVVQVNGLSIVDLSTRETDLEDIFLQLTQRKAA